MGLRVLVVDDTALYRKVVSEVLRELPDVEVVGTAVDGQAALEKIAELKPDLLTLDLEMPRYNGVEVLRELRGQGSSVGAIILSASTSTGAAATTEALNLGAFDFVLKPVGTDLSKNRYELSKRLGDCVSAFRHSRGKRPLKRATASNDWMAPNPLAPKVVPATDQSADIIVLGISTGGPEALTRVVPALPESLAAPLLIVQHMPPLFTKSLADDLQRRSNLRVCEAVDGQLAGPGVCLIAPGGKQMRIEATELGPKVVISDDPPENSCRPAVDYLFRSAAHHYGSKVLAIVMTGMGSDGERGCRLLKRQGARVLAQDESSCVVYGMPRAIIENGLADEVVPLAQMAARIASLSSQGAVV